MNNNRTILGIDLGKKRVGLSFTIDEKTIMPGGTVSVERGSWGNLIEAIKKRNPDLLVFGLPLDKEGEKTKQAQWVKKEAKKIANQAGAPFEFIDEYLSSWQAKVDKKTNLPKTGKGKNNKMELDEAAARVILEDYLSN